MVHEKRSKQSSRRPRGVFFGLYAVQGYLEVKQTIIDPSQHYWRLMQWCANPPRGPTEPHPAVHQGRLPAPSIPRGALKMATYDCRAPPSSSSASFPRRSDCRGRAALCFCHILSSVAPDNLSCLEQKSHHEAFLLGNGFKRPGGFYQCRTRCGGGSVNPRHDQTFDLLWAVATMMDGVGKEPRSLWEDLLFFFCFFFFLLCPLFHHGHIHRGNGVVEEGGSKLHGGAVMYVVDVCRGCMSCHGCVS